ncbi:unnamed protein product [Clonostachys byssicola]|uniref:Uncharacterized protein n=1 Tax=Clonostachys byssicola TaxID=160290 RepID=A0A9N9U0S2_9HYPO|nr:unnamed protein product [Clonostachys byssicola]
MESEYVPPWKRMGFKSREEMIKYDERELRREWKAYLQNATGSTSGAVATSRKEDSDSKDEDDSNNEDGQTSSTILDDKHVKKRKHFKGQDGDHPKKRQKSKARGVKEDCSGDEKPPFKAVHPDSKSDNDLDGSNDDYEESTSSGEHTMESEDSVEKSDGTTLEDRG